MAKDSNWFFCAFYSFHETVSVAKIGAPSDSEDTTEVGWCELLQTNLLVLVVLFALNTTIPIQRRSRRWRPTWPSLKVLRWHLLLSLRLCSWKIWKGMAMVQAKMCVTFTWQLFRQFLGFQRHQHRNKMKNRKNIVPSRLAIAWLRPKRGALLTVPKVQLLKKLAFRWTGLVGAISNIGFWVCTNCEQKLKT